jgi:hypothetical protein
VDPRSGLDGVEKRKFLTLPGLEPRTFGRPARSQSLYATALSRLLLYQLINLINFYKILSNILLPRLSPYIDGSRKGPVEGSCEHGNEPSGSTKCWQILQWLHNWRRLKKGSAP